jgi:hypothetical protein
MRSLFVQSLDPEKTAHSRQKIDSEIALPDAMRPISRKPLAI